MFDRDQDYLKYKFSHISAHSGNQKQWKYAAPTEPSRITMGGGSFYGY